MKVFINSIKKIEKSKWGYVLYTTVFLTLFLILFFWYMNVDLSSAPEFIYSQF